jgi:hypothetical protein
MFFGEAGMFKIKWIWLILGAALFAHCKTADIPAPYNFKVKEVQNNPYGCWMEITTDSTSTVQNISSFKGELLAEEIDSTYLLISDGAVKAFKNRTILTAKLYTHKNQSGTYILTSVLLALPGLIGAIAVPEDAGYFLLMAIPVSLVGIFQATSESSGRGNTLFYPAKNNLQDFRPYARYPGGMPEIVNYSQLYLKK